MVWAEKDEDDVVLMACWVICRAGASCLSSRNLFGEKFLVRTGPVLGCLFRISLNLQLDDSYGGIMQKYTDHHVTISHTNLYGIWSRDGPYTFA